VVTANNIFCLRGNGQDRDSLIGTADQREESGGGPPDSLYCRACGGLVTDGDQQISVNGSHAHTFFNPAGIVYELGCFRNAPGCSVVGEATMEFTWFANHSWRFGLCLLCDTHLGWLYETAEQTFYGLILTRLRR
jgi:hypothetical protein